MPELPPLPRSVEPRPRSNWASIISGSIAILALVCSAAVLSITTENQCIDRRDRRILQQPNVWLDTVRDEGAIYLVNSGPGAALIKDFGEFYKERPAINDVTGGNYQDFLNSQMFGTEGEWAFGMSSLFVLREDAPLCAGGKTEGCLRVGFDLNYLRANFMISPGQRLPVLRITNMDEIKKRVTPDAFRAWQNAFGAGLIPDDVNFRIEYCPLSSEFGPCRVITHAKLSAFPDLPTCPSGIAAQLRSWMPWQ
jgi:hypothetical protein